MTTAAAEWSWPDNKIFEDALVKFPEGMPDRWHRIAGCLPGKSPEDVMLHYQSLMDDVADIEAGRVQLPSYSELPKTGRSSSCERKKGKPWTVREHMLFLRGLEIYGKSDWRSISRNVVISRLPSQVASHAQKFFNRLKSAKKERKRSSIHDITTVSDCTYDHAIATVSDSTYDHESLPYTHTHTTMYPSTDQQQQQQLMENSDVVVNNYIDSAAALDCLALPETPNTASDASVPSPSSIHESFPPYFSSYGELRHFQM